MQKIADNGTLTMRQAKFLAALMTRPTIASAATTAGISHRTAFAMLGKPTFREALNRAQTEALEAASRQLIGSLTTAVCTLQLLVGDRDAGPGIQLQAAKAILDQAFKLREALDFETRLAALEAKQNER